MATLESHSALGISILSWSECVLISVNISSFDTNERGSFVSMLRPSNRRLKARRSKADVVKCATRNSSLERKFGALPNSRYVHLSQSRRLDCASIRHGAKTLESPIERFITRVARLTSLTISLYFTLDRSARAFLSLTFFDQNVRRFRYRRA